VMTFADKGYQGARGSVRTPFKRHRRRPRLSRREKAVNRSHATIRAIGERAIATVKGWKLLAKLHCCPKRATALPGRDPRPSARRGAALVRLKRAHCWQLR
jgi:hypothetical protein